MNQASREAVGPGTIEIGPHDPSVAFDDPSIGDHQSGSLYPMNDSHANSYVAVVFLVVLVLSCAFCVLWRYCKTKMASVQDGSEGDRRRTWRGQPLCWAHRRPNSDAELGYSQPSDLQDQRGGRHNEMRRRSPFSLESVLIKCTKRIDGDERRFHEVMKRDESDKANGKDATAEMNETLFCVTETPARCVNAPTVPFEDDVYDDEFQFDDFFDSGLSSGQRLLPLADQDDDISEYLSGGMFAFSPSLAESQVLKEECSKDQADDLLDESVVGLQKVKAQAEFSPYHLAWLTPMTHYQLIRRRPSVKKTPDMENAATPFIPDRTPNCHRSAMPVKHKVPNNFSDPKTSTETCVLQVETTGSISDDIHSSIQKSHTEPQGSHVPSKHNWSNSTGRNLPPTQNVPRGMSRVEASALTPRGSSNIASLNIHACTMPAKTSGDLNSLHFMHPPSALFYQPQVVTSQCSPNSTIGPLCVELTNKLTNISSLRAINCPTSSTHIHNEGVTTCDTKLGELISSVHGSAICRGKTLSFIDNSKSSSLMECVGSRGTFSELDLVQPTAWCSSMEDTLLWDNFAFRSGEESLTWDDEITAKKRMDITLTENHGPTMLVKYNSETF